MHVLSDIENNGVKIDVRFLSEKWKKNLAVI